MKNRKRFILSLLMIIMVGCFSAAQTKTDCKVLAPGISGSYEGGCKKGLASGAGKAIGTDSYEGEFKNGYPSGKGKYTWANGNTYDGFWKKGYMEGFGVLVVKLAGRDSVVKGYWAKNEYIGVEAIPYKINQKSMNVMNVTFVRINDKKDEIEIAYSQKGRPLPIYSFGVTEIQGTYLNIVKTDFTKTLTGITYPFRAETSGGGYTVDFTISQRGYWRVSVEVTDK